MNQEQIREICNNYIERDGIKYVYIANYLGLQRSSVCHFLKGRNMRKDNLTKLENYLKDKKVI